jgi:hypothetical protein
MISNSKLVATVMVLLPSSGAAYVLECSADSRSNQTVAEDASRDLEKDLHQVRLKVKAPPEANIGDPLIVDIELENPSTRDVAFTPGQDLQAFYVDVIGTNHVRAKRTALGKEVFQTERRWGLFWRKWRGVSKKITPIHARHF